MMANGVYNMEQKKAKIWCSQLPVLQRIRDLFISSLHEKHNIKNIFESTPKRVFRWRKLSFQYYIKITWDVC